MKIISLLKTPELQRIKLIAGAHGVERETKLIGVIEAPDIESYLFKEQLLVTTGYHYYKHIDRLKLLLKKMASVGCAGLGIKSNRYFKEIPHDVIQLANDLNFPLLLTPSDESLSQTVSSLIKVIIQSDELKLRHAIQQNQKLSKLALNNTKFNVFLDQCVHYLTHDIVLLDSHFRVCFSNQAIWNKEAEITAELRANNQVDYLKLEQETIVNCDNRKLRIIPLMVMYPENKSFIGIFDLENPSSMEQLQLQQIQNIISLMNSQTDVRKEDNIHQRNDFFLNVMANQISSDLIQQQSLRFNIDLKKNCYCALCGVKPAKEGNLLFLNQIEQIRRLSDWFIEEYDIQATSFIFKQQLVFIISETQNIDHFLKSLALFLTRSLDNRFILKIGLSYTKLPIDKLAQIYQESKEAYTLAEQSTTTIQQFRPKKVSELLQLIPKNEAVSFINETLGPLLKLKNKQEADDLMQTLRAYVYNHQQINIVAKQLFIHRNTVVYRLNKAADILKTDFEDTEVIQRLFVALLLYNLD